MTRRKRGRHSRPKTLPELLAWAAHHGYPVEHTGGGHLRLMLPGGPVFMPKSASDWRSIRNTWTNIQHVLRRTA